MPSTNWRTATLVLTAAVVAYAVTVAQRALLGLLLAAVLYLAGWLVARLSPGNPLDDMSRPRTMAAGGLAVFALVYAVLIATEVLLGALVAATVILVAWITSPVGPVARWLDART